ncbi:ABC transporter, ATP-binding protein [Mycobacterium marinum MB2]|nr:ABC transporter, ATP-binding protein [Mycobacterium marinum MB2]
MSTAKPWLRVNSCVEPAATSTPSLMIPTSSASETASSISCVVRTTVRPSERSSRIAFHTSCLPSMSSPLEGSSRNSICGLCATARATSTRRRIPPESAPTLRFRYFPRPNCSTSSPSRRFLSDFGQPAIARLMRICSTGDIHRSRATSCSATPMSGRSCVVLSTGTPSTSSWPLVGVSNVVAILMVVVLPAPLRPNRQ